MDTIERRLAALERQAKEHEEKRKAMRAQLIALQLTLGRLLPVISAAPAGAIDAALEAAQATVPTLRDLGFDADEAHAVAEAIEAIRADLLGEEETASWH